MRTDFLNGYEMSSSIAELDDLLEKCSASLAFKQAVRDLEAKRYSDAIRTSTGSPPVKVLRTIAMLLEKEPELEIRNVEIEARSGCSDFFGTLKVNDGEHEYTFVWDCKWRAEQEGWQDPWGYPDQARAAQLFGYRCFKRFDRTR
jgi:hypothetical protein